MPQKKDDDEEDDWLPPRVDKPKPKNFVLLQTKKKKSEGKS